MTLDRPFKTHATSADIMQDRLFAKMYNLRNDRGPYFYPSLGFAFDAPKFYTDPTSPCSYLGASNGKGYCWQFDCGNVAPGMPCRTPDGSWTPGQAGGPIRAIDRCNPYPVEIGPGESAGSFIVTWGADNFAPILEDTPVYVTGYKNGSVAYHQQIGKFTPGQSYGTLRLQGKDMGAWDPNAVNSVINVYWNSPVMTAADVGDWKIVFSTDKCESHTATIFRVALNPKPQTPIVIPGFEGGGAAPSQVQMEDGSVGIVNADGTVTPVGGPSMPGSGGSLTSSSSGSSGSSGPSAPSGSSGGLLTSLLPPSVQNFSVGGISGTTLALAGGLLALLLIMEKR